MSLFTRSRAFANLTPAERAFLKLVEGIVAAALIAGGQAFFQQLALGTVDWQGALHTALIAAGTVIALAVKKYATAFGDPALPATPDTAPTGAPTPAEILTQVQAAAQNLQQAA